MSAPVAQAATAQNPWYAQVSREQWRAFFAAFFGWVLDSFDFNILAFVLIDIQRSFTVDRALAGLLGTVTLLTRLAGAAAAGSLADRYGRKLPLILSLIWFSLFALLSGFSTSYTMLFALRGLFGVGMGAEWASSLPFLFEHWPARHRGIASGLLMGGWYWGYLFAAAAFQFIYPAFGRSPDLGWRVLLWIAIVPASFTLWIRLNVADSPVWLERQRYLELEARRGATLDQPKVSLVRIFRPDLIGVTIHTTAVLGAFMCIYYSLSFWYPTLLRDMGRPTLPFLAAFNVGAIVGTAAWGSLSETALGRRGTVTASLVLGIASLPLYLRATSTFSLAVGALLMGLFGMGIWGIAPAYAAERFPTSSRAVGSGFCYNAAAALGALMPYLLGAFQDRAVGLASAMTASMLTFGAIAAALIWAGPETKGRQFTPTEAQGDSP